MSALMPELAASEFCTGVIIEAVTQDARKASPNTPTAYGKAESRGLLPSALPDKVTFAFIGTEEAPLDGERKYPEALPLFRFLLCFG